MGFVLDENGGLVLDQNGQPILDEASVSAPVVPQSKWTLYVRDDAGVRVAELDTFESATLIPRFNAVGDWQVVAPATEAAQLLTTPKYGLEFVRDGEVILSGPVTTRTREFGVGVDGYTFQGKDDQVWLSRRKASPEPATAAAPYDDSAYDVRTGAASTVIRAYVNVNAGPGAVTARQVDGLAVPAVAAFGSTVTGRARWQTLIDLLAELATAGGVGFRTRQLTFDVYQPTDLSAAVKFSTALGNLAGFSYSDAAPEVNHVYVAGGGEGTARVIRELTDTTSVTEWGRVEEFRDRRDTTDTAELDQAGQAMLTESATKRGFSLAPIETASVRFGATYNLGDQVTVIVDGVPVVDVVREVRIDLNADGETVAPTVGDPDADPSRPSIFAAHKRMERRVRNLERS